jgi:hypothetical protein
MSALQRLRRELERRRKWLTLRGIWNILLLSAAIMVIASVYQLATLAVTTGNYLNIFLWWFVLAGFLLLYAMFSPDLMDTVFQMLGFKLEEKKNEDKTKNEV